MTKRKENLSITVSSSTPSGSWVHYILILGIGLSAVLTFRSAHAGDVQEAIRQRHEALGDYYKKLKASPDRGPATRDRLFQETVQPKNHQVTQTMHDTANELVQSLGGATRAEPAKKRSPAQSSPVIRSTSEIPLDGKGIPREVIFPGKPR